MRMGSRFLNAAAAHFIVALFVPWAGPLAAAAESPSGMWQERSIGAERATPLPAETVWFRSWLRLPDDMTGPGPSGPDLWRDSMTLTLQGVPGPVIVFLNGIKIIEGRDLPIEKPRRFKVPKGIFEKSVFNALVIQLDGKAAIRGLTVAPVFAGYFDEVRMEHPWQTTVRKPSDLEMKAAVSLPSVAVYTEKDFQPATTVMQASPEPVRGQFVSPADALRNLRPESDLIVEELLHEPEVAQPTHVSFDEHGRLWVAQYRQYPYPAGVTMISRDKYYRSKYDRVPPPPPDHALGADIISVHEDRDGDGRYEIHRPVLTGLNMANAVVHGHGGLWVMNTPYLLFYPDANEDDVPDEPPEVRLQGFGLEDTHSVANGLTWGPDGWLYGAQGSTTTSRVTRPGVDATNAPGVYAEGCMSWRYHPERKLYEIFTDGSGNTFGVSFDAEGRLFTGHNGGVTRGWHHIQEGRFLKQGKDPGKFGPSQNPFVFGELPMMHSTHPVPRFTHMTILGEGTALPDRLRGRFLGIDPLHHTVVASERKPAGSTFETTDIGFPLRTEDLTFRPVYLANAPDGSLVIADFREEYIAHGQNYQSQIDATTGRIYRLRGKNLPLERDVDLSKKTTAELIDLLAHANPWHRQTAVRLLSERHDALALPRLLVSLERSGTHPALEALWVLHQMGWLDDTRAAKTLTHRAPMVRAWTIRLLGDERKLSASLALQVTTLATLEPDAEVRCQMLSTARRLPAAQALPLVRAIALRTNDIADAFIPLMAWFVIESQCANQRDAVLALFDDAEFWKAPFVRQHLESRLMRRFAASGARQELMACAQLLAKAPTDEDRQVLMVGFEEAFRGRAVPPLPDELMRALARTGRRTLLLRVRQGEAAAMSEALQQFTDEKNGVAQRLAAIRIFGEVKHAAAVPGLITIATREGPADPRVAACTALQLYDDPSIGDALTKAWPDLPLAVQNAALNLLTSRAVWSLRLLESFANGRVPLSAFSTDIRTRLRLHKEERLTALVEKHFPATSPTPRESLRPRIEQIRHIIVSQPGDPYKGESQFNARCASCHTLFYKGGRIGPDLTSYQRDDLGTLLISIIDPNAEIREGFENHIITTQDGRTLSGFLADQDANVVVLRGFDGADISLRRADIVTLNPAGGSLMPEFLLDGMTDAEIRNLFAYLRQSQPISK
ncbi:MAG: c-type cytochrome [Pedosphaera sp.]|nr:c-type cytochrome [Pedosphaera sp.]